MRDAGRHEPFCRFGISADVVDICSTGPNRVAGSVALDVGEQYRTDHQIGHGLSCTTPRTLANLCQKAVVRPIATSPKNVQESTSSRTPSQPSSRRVNRSHWLPAASALLGTTTLRSMTLVWSPRGGTTRGAGSRFGWIRQGRVENYCLS